MHSTSQREIREQGKHRAQHQSRNTANDFVLETSSQAAPSSFVLRTFRSVLHLLLFLKILHHDSGIRELQLSRWAAFEARPQHGFCWERERKNFSYSLPFNLQESNQIFKRFCRKKSIDFYTRPLHT